MKTINKKEVVFTVKPTLTFHKRDGKYFIEKKGKTSEVTKETWEQYKAYQESIVGIEVVTLDPLGEFMRGDETKSRVYPVAKQVTKRR